MTDEEYLAAHEAERTTCEVWTRVMGYFRPYSHFNNGKKSEFNDRKWFNETRVCACATASFVSPKSALCQFWNWMGKAFCIRTFHWCKR